MSGGKHTAAVVVMLTPKPRLPALSHGSNKDQRLIFDGAKTNHLTLKSWNGFRAPVCENTADVPGKTCLEAGGLSL